MRIKAGDTIAGVEITRVREFLRKSPDASWNMTFAARELGLSLSGAKALIASLLAEGYVEASGIGRAPRYLPTLKGNALRGATAARPVRRKKASEALAGFVERANLMGRDPSFLHRVDAAVVFGSFVTGTGDVGDVDIAMRLARKLEIVDWLEATRASVRQARAAGRVFSRYIDEMYWPDQQARMFLKNRSRTLSLVDLDAHRDFLLGLPHRVLIGTFP